MKRYLIAILIFTLTSAAHAQTTNRVWTTPDWNSQWLCQKETKYDSNQKYCLEMISLAYTSPLPMKGVALLIPGFFQNGAVFDLSPEKGISFARYLMQEKGLKIYFLHVRGIGNSDITRQYNLDDIAIDDIPAAVSAISRIENQKIYLIGHSQGGITAQASLSGLSRCGKLNCFDRKTAKLRQSGIRGLIAIAANPSMSTRYTRDELPLVGKLGWIFHPITDAMTNYIPAHSLISRFSKEVNLANSPIWGFLYSTHSVSADAKKALYEKTLDGSSSAILKQYSEAIAHDGLKNSSGEKYTDALKNIEVPVAIIAFGKDVFSPPLETYEDDFLKINSIHRQFFTFSGQSHEDFMMEPKLHSEFSDAVDGLLAPH